MMVRHEQVIPLPDAARSAHAVPVLDHHGGKSEPPPLTLEATRLVFHQHRAPVVDAIVGEAAPPAAVPNHAPDKAAGRIDEPVKQLEPAGRRIVDADVRLRRRAGIVGMRAVEPSLVEKPAVEVLGAGGGGQRNEPPGATVVAGDRRIGDRVGVVPVGGGGLRGVGRGEHRRRRPAAGERQTARCGLRSRRRDRRQRRTDGDKEPAVHGHSSRGGRTSHRSPKKSAAAIRPGRTASGFCRTSMIAQSGSIGTCRALLR